MHIAGIVIISFSLMIVIGFYLVYETSLFSKTKKEKDKGYKYKITRIN